MTREAARVSKVSALNSGGSERARSISPMVSGGSLGRSAADAQRQAMSNPSKQVFRMGASGSRLPRITPLVAEKTAGQGRDQGSRADGPRGYPVRSTVRQFEPRRDSSRILLKHAGSDRTAQALREPGGGGGCFFRGAPGGNGGPVGPERRRKNHHRFHDRGAAGPGPGGGRSEERGGARGNRSGEAAPGTGAAGSGAARGAFGAPKPGTVRRHLRHARRGARARHGIGLRRGGVGRPRQGSRAHVQRRYEAPAEPGGRVVAFAADPAAR